VINSDKKLNYFSDNKPYHFCTHFQYPLNLGGVWKVDLVDIYMMESKIKVRDSLYVHCDVCGETIIDGGKDNLL